MAVGHGGQVLLSASAASLAIELLPAGSGLRDLGEHHLRDLGRPEHLYQLVHPDLPADFPRLVTARQPGADLPSRVAALIGRNEEIAQISARLADGSVRLLTLVGPGGTGKTTLAIRVATDLANQFRDGASFVDLSNAHDTNAVLVAVARAIGLGEIIDRPLQDELVDRLRDRRMLLVLDNLEQVTEVGRRRGPAPERLPGPDGARHEPRAPPRPRRAAVPRPAARAAAGGPRARDRRRDPRRRRRPPVRRPCPRRPPGVRGDRRQRRGGRRDLPPARRPAAGDRARGGPPPPVLARGAPRPARRPARPPPQRSARPARAPADAAGGDGLELRAPLARRAAPVRDAGGIRERRGDRHRGGDR